LTNQLEEVPNELVEDKVEEDAIPANSSTQWRSFCSSMAVVFGFALSLALAS
jgi:hypothetical protein